MAEFQPAEKQKMKRVEEFYDELRKEGKTNLQIFAEAYEPLRQLARRLLTGKLVGDSMTSKRLVADTYVKLYGKLASDCDWQSGVHFFRTMAVVMQNLLIDYLRRRRRGTLELTQEQLRISSRT